MARIDAATLPQQLEERSRQCPTVRATLDAIEQGMPREEALSRAVLVLSDAVEQYRKLAVEAISQRPPAPIVLEGVRRG